MALILRHDDGSAKFFRKVITLPSTRCHITEGSSVCTGALYTAGSLFSLASVA